MSKLQIKLLKDKPFKTYSAQVEIDYHIDELCNFLAKHKDKNLAIIINGKETRFNSIASRKKFVEGFRRAGNIVFGHVKAFATESQESINKLNNNLTQSKSSVDQLKEEIANLKHELTNAKTVSKIKTEAWQDSIEEYKYSCNIIKERLDKIEPVIDIIRSAQSDGDLNKAALKVKKEKL